MREFLFIAIRKNSAKKKKKSHSKLCNGKIFFIGFSSILIIINVRMGPNEKSKVLFWGTKVAIKSDSCLHAASSRYIEEICPENFL